MELDENQWITTTTPQQLLAVDEALCRLIQEDRNAGELVKLRYFSGMSVEEAADALDIPRTTAYRHWTYARAWIRAKLQTGADPSSS